MHKKKNCGGAFFLLGTHPFGIAEYKKGVRKEEGAHGAVAIEETRKKKGGWGEIQYHENAGGRHWISRRRWQVK